MAHTSTRPRSTAAVPVPDPEAWELALVHAGGDVRRLVVASPPPGVLCQVVVANRPAPKG